jgi:hypothetical protein
MKKSKVRTKGFKKGDKVQVSRRYIRWEVDHIPCNYAIAGDPEKFKPSLADIDEIVFWRTCASGAKHRGVVIGYGEDKDIDRKRPVKVALKNKYSHYVGYVAQCDLTRVG